MFFKKEEKRIKNEVEDIADKYVESCKDYLELEEKLEKIKKENKKYKDGLNEIYYYLEKHRNTNNEYMVYNLLELIDTLLRR